MGTPNPISEATSKAGKAIMRLVGGAFFILIVVVTNLADCRSCVRRFSGDAAGSHTAGGDRRVVVPDQTDANHRRMVAALAKLYAASGQQQPQVPRLFIEKSDEVNAASFGEGVFLFNEGDGALPDWALDGIAAHEVAHDVLRHSKKAKDLGDVLDVLAEVVVVFGGRKDSEQDVHDIVAHAALPTYSRGQEYEADAKAIELLASAGSENPRQLMANTLRLLLAEGGNTGGGFFDSHPSTQERIAALEGEGPASAAAGGGIGDQKGSEARENSAANAQWAQPFVLGESPPWTARYGTLVRHVTARDGGVLRSESPCYAPSGKCEMFLTAANGGLLLTLPMPGARPVGGGDSAPKLPTAIWRDSDLDGWPDAFAMTDNGEPFGQCFDPAATIGDGFCRLPKKGAIKSASDPMFGVVAMWMTKIQGLVVHELPPQ